MKKQTKRLEQVEIVHPNAAGLDIGSREIWVCVLPSREGETVRPYGQNKPCAGAFLPWRNRD